VVAVGNGLVVVAIPYLPLYETHSNLKISLVNVPVSFISKVCDVLQ
jgi:hypothetical protein